MTSRAEGARAVSALGPLTNPFEERVSFDPDSARRRPRRGGDGDSSRLADPDYALSPVVAVRVAGLPVAGLERMRCTRTWRLVDELADVSSRLRREGAELSEPLHEVIGGVAAGPLRAGLVALRRAVFAGRRLGGRAVSAEVLGALPAGLAARIGAWTALRRRADELRAALPGVLAEEAREKTGVLREAVSDAGFRHGLAQGSAVLADRLEAWLGGRPPERQEVLRLARYLARASVKTSPYATFTAGGLGRWETDGPAVATGGEPSWLVMAELDRAVLRPLWAVLTRHRRVRERARLRVNPSAADDGERVWFLSPGPGEPLSSVPATAQVRQALDWVRRRDDATLAAAPGIEPLAEAGLVEYVPPYDEQGPDPMGGSWRRGWRPMGRPRTRWPSPGSRRRCGPSRRGAPASYGRRCGRCCRRGRPCRRRTCCGTARSSPVSRGG
ncbi:hypothetical protein GCM10020001_103610 [Nonomuraea salmonea]